MRNEMLAVFNQFEEMRKRLKINGKLGFDGPRVEIYNQCSGVIPGKVYTIGAYSNVGKSKFAYAHIAYFLKCKKKVLIINLEVDAAHCLMNIVQAVDNQSTREMMNRNLTDQKLMQYENLLIIDNLYKLDDIVKKIEEEQADIVFIDFVQNIEARGGGSYEQNASVAKTIQRTAIKTKSVIYSLSQVSNEMGRNLQNGYDDFVSLKGSGEYYASSDVIFILMKGEAPGEMFLKIAKNKFGPNGLKFLLGVDYARNQFNFIRQIDEY